MKSDFIPLLFTDVRGGGLEREAFVIGDGGVCCCLR